NISDYEDFMLSFYKSRDGLKGPWRTYAFGEIARRWSRFCNDVNVVIVDSNMHNLWFNFCLASGIADSGVYDGKVSSRGGNKSMSHEDTLFLLEINKYMNSSFPGNSALRKRVSKFYLRNF